MLWAPSGLKYPEFLAQYLLRVHRLAALMQVQRSLVSNYLKEYSVVCSDIESEVRKYNYLGQMDRRKNEVLYCIVRILKPKVVVETGVVAGVSSAVILRAMRANGVGQLVSIDAGVKSFDGIQLPADKPIGFIVPEDLRSQWKLIMGLSKDVLKPVLEAHHSIDMFFHDSQHTYENMMFEYTTA